MTLNLVDQSDLLNRLRLHSYNSLLRLEKYIPDEWSCLQILAQDINCHQLQHIRKYPTKTCEFNKIIYINSNYKSKSMAINLIDNY